MKVWVGDERLIAVGEGNGPVNALDHALRRPARRRYPQLAHIHLTDYRVRILDTEADTDAVVRVLIDSTDGDRAWTTIGVSTNIIEARWQALTDALVWGLVHSEQLGSAAMAAPEHVPVDRTKPVRAYESPPRRPESWLPDRPGELVEEGQPRGDRLGHQGPDQGYALRLARQLRGQAHPHAGRAREGRPRRRRRGRPEAGVALRPGAGRPRPHRGPHGLGLPRRGARQGAGRPAQAPLRGGVAPAPLRGAAPHRRPRPRTRRCG